MPPVSAIWTILRSPLARYAVLGLVIALLCWRGYLAIDSRGYARCEGEHELARLQSEEAAHQLYLKEVARGDALSAELAKTQRRLNETKTEYLAYAGAITGNCPASLGVLLTATSPPGSLPKAPGALADSAPPVDAAPIAANIAENRWRFEVNYATCAALVKWHEEALK